MKNTSRYYKVIQKKDDGNKWIDLAFYETNAQFKFKTSQAKNEFNEDLNHYRKGYGLHEVRVIIRRTKINDED